MKTPASFKVMDLTRAIRGARAAGLEIDRVEIEPGTGKIVVVAGRPGVAKAVTGWEDFDEAPQNALRS